MWTLIESKSVPVTRSLAKRIAGLDRVPNEREFRPQRAAGLERDISANKCLVFRWAIAHLDGGKTYRINGQHTSRLFSDGAAIPDKAMATLETYDCDTLEDVCDLWSHFDSQATARSKYENTRIHVGANPAFLEVSSKVANVCLGAISTHTYGIGYPNKLDMSTKSSALNGNEEFVLWVNALSCKEHKHLLRVGVVWAMFQCWLKSSKNARVFWQRVAEGDGEKKSPERCLDKYLLTHNINLGRGAKPSVLRVTAREMMCRSVYAWNSWRKGHKTVECLRFYPSAPDPEVI